MLFTRQQWMLTVNNNVCIVHIIVNSVVISVIIVNAFCFILQ